MFAKNMGLNEVSSKSHMGTMGYERPIVEFKLGLPVWHECLEVAVEKFELASASPTEVGVMLKNRYSNDTAVDGKYLS